MTDPIIPLLEKLQARSLRDKKTLTQKALKLCEESGELAQVILPLEGAYGTTYKKAELAQVLEEGTDAATVALSVVFTAGFTSEQIISEIERKLAKWDMAMDRSDEALRNIK